MGKGLVAFLIAASCVAWVYGKFMRNSGSNTQTSVIAAGVIGFLVFVVAFIVLGFVPGL